MKVFTCPRKDEIGKFGGVVHAFPEIWDGIVLDVGCRSGNLKLVLKEHSLKVSYVGVDLYPPAEVIADLEKGLPFFDKAFKVVVALDVLEHIDHLHKAFEELLRVSAEYVVLSFPNAYELKGRIKFLLGYPLSGKYGLPPEPPPDRHRWLFSFKDARKFVYAMAKRNGFRVKSEGCLIGPRRGWILGRKMVSLFPNLFSPWYLVLLTRI